MPSCSGAILQAFNVIFALVSTACCIAFPTLAGIAHVDRYCSDGCVLATASGPLAMYPQRPGVTTSWTVRSVSLVRTQPLDRSYEDWTLDRVLNVKFYNGSVGTTFGNVVMDDMPSACQRTPGWLNAGIDIGAAEFIWILVVLCPTALMQVIMDWLLFFADEEGNEDSPYRRRIPAETVRRNFHTAGVTSIRAINLLLFTLIVALLWASAVPAARFVNRLETEPMVPPFTACGTVGSRSWVDAGFEASELLGKLQVLAVVGTVALLVLLAFIVPSFIFAFRWHIRPTRSPSDGSGDGEAAKAYGDDDNASVDDRASVDGAEPCPVCLRRIERLVLLPHWEALVGDATSHAVCRRCYPAVVGRGHCPMCRGALKQTVTNPEEAPHPHAVPSHSDEENEMVEMEPAAVHAAEQV